MSLREAWTPTVTGPRAREFGLFASSTVLYQGARFAFSIAAARALPPAAFSSWALVVALLVYAPSVLLGVVNGMARQLPMLAGRGDDAGARRATMAAWTATAVGVVAVLVAAVVFAIAWRQHAELVIAIGLVAAGTVIYGTQQFVFRSMLRFTAASLQQALFGLTVLGSAGLLSSADGVDLTLVSVAYGAGVLVSVGAGALIARPEIPPRADIAELRYLMKIGFPIMLAGLAFSVFITSDRWMAVAVLGATGAAPYALASLVASATLVIPSVVSQQTYPRMALARGQAASAEQLLQMARHQGLLAAGLVAPVAVAIAGAAWLGIPVVLPEYLAARVPIVILSGGLVVLGFLTGYGNYLNVVGGQWRYLAVQLFGVVSAVLLMLIGGHWLGMLGIAGGMSGGYVVYGTALRAVATRTRVTDE
jgi:O-antigen/teichoic acid export membrane protein